MKSLLQRTGVVLAGMISLALAPVSIKADPSVSTDSVTRYVREHEEISDTDKSHYFAIYNAVNSAFQEFINNRTDGKTLDAFIAEFKVIAQKFGEFAKTTHNHQLHAKLKSLHKDLQSFVSLLQKHRGNHYLVIAAKLSESDLAHLIPNECSFKKEEIIDALKYRCSR